MKDFYLKIQICSPGVVEKLNARAKYNSVLFIDYTPFVEEIFNSFESDITFNRFRYQLYEHCKDLVHIKKYSNGYRLESNTIAITPNVLASCLPRNIRRQYFKRDDFYEKYFPREFNYHLM